MTRLSPIIAGLIKEHANSKLGCAIVDEGKDASGGGVFLNLIHPAVID